MNLTVYRLIFKLLSPIALLWLNDRAKKTGDEWQVRSPERFGHYSWAAWNAYSLKEINETIGVFDFSRPVWVHAVSLGETRAAQPLVRALLDQGLPVLLTHMTATGRNQGAKIFADDIGAGRLCQAWVPYDLPSAVNGFLDYWKPRCGILIEREIWPNLVLLSKQHKVPMVLAGARFSESSLKQAKWLGKVFKEALASFDLVLAQTRADALRLQTFNVQQLEIFGNLKFDVDVSKSQVHMGEVLRQHINRPTVVIASTREGEEELFIRALEDPALRRMIKTHNTLYILVPRHPQRFAEVETLFKESSLSFVSRSQIPTDEQLRTSDIMLGDQIGEMFMYYAMADVTIVAGSFANLGGQNHIEASVIGVPVILGPYTTNFEQAAEDAIVEGAARRVEDPRSAVELAEQLIDNKDERLQMINAAKQWLSLHNGVTERIMEAVKPYLK